MAAAVLLQIRTLEVVLVDCALKITHRRAETNKPRSWPRNHQKLILDLSSMSHDMRGSEITSHLTVHVRT